MHEVAMGRDLVDAVCGRLQAAEWNPAIERVAVVRIRIGVMSGVVPQALKSAFRAAVVGTAIQGAELEIDSAELIVLCPQCQKERVLDDIRRLECPVCHTSTPKVIQGRELEIDSIEVVDAAANPGSTPAHS